MENITSLLEDIIKSLSQDPSVKDLSLFLGLFNSLLMTGNRHSPSDNPDDKLSDTSVAKSSSLLLLEGVASLAKDFISWPAAQLDIFKNIVDFAVTDIVDLNFRKHCAEEDVEISSGNCEDYVSYKHPLCPVEEGRLTERTCYVKSEHRDDTKTREQQKRISDLVVSAECTACIDLLCQVIVNDWGVTLHWMRDDLSNGSVGEMGCCSWHPLHKWFIKLYAVACFLVSHSSDSKLKDQAMRLQKGLSQYVKKYATEKEHAWIDGFEKGELIDFEESCFEEEFSSPVGEQTKCYLSCCNRYLHNDLEWPGLEPGPRDPENNILIIRLPRLPYTFNTNNIVTSNT